MKKRKKFFSFSFYFWIAFVFVIITLFFINRAVIARTITKIKDSPSFSKPEIVTNDVGAVIKKSNSSEIVDLKNNEKNLTGDIEKDEISSIDEVSSDNKETDKIEEIQEEPLESQINEEIKDKPIIVPPKNETRDIEIYFASVNDNGVVTREKCVRSVERSMSPMVDSLNALLQGPTKEEAKHGIRSFIPADTRLLSASIKEETALINLSDDFQFNRYGVEGYNIQLQQVVFTVCSFPTVKSVQFLIEGQKRDFLGSEGVWIGSPLTINSF